MKASTLQNSIWLGVSVVAFSAGYFFSDAGTHDAPRRPPNVATDGAGLASGAEGEIREFGSSDGCTPRIRLSEEQARMRTFQVLSVPNRLERIRQLAEMLESINSENFRSAMDAFVVQTRKEGRLHRIEWDMMLERVGEVAGTAAMDEALTTDSPTTNKVRFLLTGFSAASPKVAIAWLEAQSPERQRALLSPLLAGISRTDGKLAFNFIAAEGKEVWDANAGAMLDSVIQSGGFRSAEELFQSLRTDPKFQGKLGRVQYDLIDRRLRMAVLEANPATTFEWASGQFPMGVDSISNVVQKVGGADPAFTLEWLDRNTGTMPAPQLAGPYSNLANAWLAKAPDGLKGWLQANPTHRQQGKMAGVAITAFLGTGKTRRSKRCASKYTRP